MSPQIIKFLITATLLLHGLAHGTAFFALLTFASQNGKGAKLPFSSWLFPSLKPRTGAYIASVFWLLSAVGFILASLSFWGTFLPDEVWRSLALVSAVISTVGIILFKGTWPGAPTLKISILDTVIALVINLAVFVCLLWLHWPPYAMFGK